jgi:uncharacterized protein
MLDKNEILDILKELKKELKDEYKVKNIGLFGSYSKKNYSAESDIDILVEFYQGADLFDYIGLNLFLEEKFQHKVDLVSKSAVREELKEEIMSSVIYA